MIELFIHDEHLQKYMKTYNEYCVRRSGPAGYLPIDSQTLTSPDAGVFHMYSEGRPSINHFPTSCSLQALKSGANNYVFVTYVYNCRVFVNKAAFFAGWNHFANTAAGKWDGWKFYNQNDWYVNTYEVGINKYKNQNIEFRWSVPVVTQWQFIPTAKTFTFKASSLPYASYSNKIDSTIGTSEHYNTRTVPYDTVQMGNIGSLTLPSSNRCVSNSYLDTGNDRLVVVTGYSSEGNTWPETRIDVSYHDTTTDLTFIPLKQTTYWIEAALRSTRAFGNIDNISNLDITKWGNYYIIAVSYDRKLEGRDVQYGTLLLKIDSTVPNPTVEWFTNIKGAGFGAVQGLSSGSML